MNSSQHNTHYKNCITYYKILQLQKIFLPDRKHGGGLITLYGFKLPLPLLLPTNHGHCLIKHWYSLQTASLCMFDPLKPNLIFCSFLTFIEVNKPKSSAHVSFHYSAPVCGYGWPPGLITNIYWFDFQKIISLKTFFFSSKF